MKEEIKIPKSLLKDFVIDYCNSNSEILVLRTGKINTDKEAYEFVKEFGSMTGCHYILNFTNPNPTRIVYHTSWICRFSKRNKMPGSKFNKNCAATLSYRIKNVCNASGRKDRFMCRVPPKPGILRIKLMHTHPLDYPPHIEFMIWSEEMNKTVEERIKDDNYGDKDIKEEITSDCEISESGLPDIYQLPQKRKSNYHQGRRGRPRLASSSSRNTANEFTNSLKLKGDQTLSEEPPPVSDATCPVTTTSSLVCLAANPTVPISTSLQANKTESSTAQSPKVNVFIIQMKPGTTTLAPNFEVKPGATPTPNFDLKMSPLGQNVTTFPQNILPSNLIFSPSHFLNPTLSDKGSQSLLNPNTVQSTNSINSCPFPITMLKTNESISTPKTDEFILPIISTVVSEKSEESKIAPNMLDPNPNNSPQNNLADPTIMEEYKDESTSQLELSKNSLVEKPIPNPKLEDLEIYKNLSSPSQEVGQLEIDGEQYIPKELTTLDIYGLHVAERLRKLDQKTREFVQKSIDGLLFDAEIGLGDFTQEKSQDSWSSKGSSSSIDEKCETLDSGSTWSVLSDKKEC